jgi:hypothetical protein
LHYVSDLQPRHLKTAFVQPPPQAILVAPYPDYARRLNSFIVEDETPVKPPAVGVKLLATGIANEHDLSTLFSYHIDLLSFYFCWLLVKDHKGFLSSGLISPAVLIGSRENSHQNAENGAF